MFVHSTKQSIKQLLMLFLWLLTLIPALPQPVAAQESIAAANTVTFRLEDIFIYDETAPEQVGPFNPEDDPYFIVIKFRSRFFTPDSTQVVVCGHTPNSSVADPLCGKPWDFEDLDENESATIPEGMNGATFSNVHYSTLDSIAHGDYPEIIGVALVAMENEHSLDEALGKAAEQANKVREELLTQIEKGKIIDAFVKSTTSTGDDNAPGDDSVEDTPPLAGVGCGGENLSQSTPDSDLGLYSLAAGGIAGFIFGGGQLDIAGLAGLLIGEALIELYADNPVDIRVLGYLTVENDSLVKQCNDIDINNDKNAFLTVLPQSIFNECPAGVPCHRFQRDEGDPIKFVGLDGEWHVSLTISADAATSQPADPTYQPRARPKTLHTFLPLAAHESGKHMEETIRSASLHTLQYNVQFLTPWDEGVVEPGHWPNTHERAVAIGEALACYDLVTLNESVNDARRQAIVDTMRERAPTCGKSNLLLGESYFTSVSGPRVQDAHITDLKPALDALQDSAFYTNFYTGETATDYLVRNPAVPLVGDELTIISRYPIVDWNSYIYTSAYGIDAMAAKGILHARIQVGDAASQDYIDVFTTHLQASEPKIRRAQILELGDFIADLADPAIPVMLLGDFNVSGPYPGRILEVKENDVDEVDEQSLYDHLMQTLTTLPTSHELQDIGLNLPTGTNQDDVESIHRRNRIDHIFLSPGLLSVDPATVRVKEFAGNGWDTLSDHAGVEARLEWQKTIFVPTEGKPDLIIEDIQVMAQGVWVTIKNVGDAAVQPGQNLWIDLYINPHTPPASVNQLWSDMGDYGLVWGLDSSALPLPPGAQIVLALNDLYFTSERSHYPEEIPTGSQIYVQVDSASSTGYGGVLETHEEAGETYNNISFVLTQETIDTSLWDVSVSAADISENGPQAPQTVMLTAPRPR